MINPNKLPNRDLVLTLQLAENVYDFIEKEFKDDIFRKCMGYYDFEQALRIETNYLIAYALTNYSKNKSTKKRAELKKEALFFHCFNLAWYSADRSLFNDETDYPHDLLLNRAGNVFNRFVTGVDNFVNDYRSNSENLKNYNSVISYLSVLLLKLTEDIIEAIFSLNIELDYDEANLYFKDFIGRSGHIKADKDWESINLTYFRDLYKTEDELM